MNEFRLQNKRSIIGLLIRLVVFFILANISMSFLESITGNLGSFYWYPIGIGMLFLIYNFISQKTLLVIKEGTLVLIRKTNIMSKESRWDIPLEDIKAIRLQQRHDFIYGTQTLNLQYQNGRAQNISLVFRYYQLVQFQDYMKEHTKIECELIG